MSPRLLLAEALLCTVVAAAAMAAPPVVRVSVEVTVPQRERWDAAGLLGETQEQLLRIAVAQLRRFEYLRWTDRGPAQAHLHLIVEEDPESPRPPGAKPWVLRMTRGDLRDQEKFGPLPVAKGKEIHLLPRNEKTTALQLRQWFAQAMQALGNDATANALVRTMLREISVANDVREHVRKIDVGVSYDELKAKDDGTQLEARLIGRPKTRPREDPANVRMRLEPDGPSSGRYSRPYTDCSLVWSNVDPADARDYAAGAKEKVTVFVWRYYAEQGLAASNNTKTERTR